MNTYIDMKINYGHTDTDLRLGPQIPESVNVERTLL